jgi:hypothetical protein
MRPQARERACLVGLHQPAIARHIGGQDCGKSLLHRFAYARRDIPGLDIRCLRYFSAG